MKSKPINYEIAVKFVDILINSILYQYTIKLKENLLLASNYIYEILYTKKERGFLNNKNHKKYFQKLKYGFHFNIGTQPYTAKPGINKRYMGIHCVPKKILLFINKETFNFDFIKKTFEASLLFENKKRLLSYRLLTSFKDKYVKINNVNKLWINTTSRFIKCFPNSKLIFLAIDTERNARSDKQVEFKTVFSLLKNMTQKEIIKDPLSLFGIDDKMNNIELFLNSDDCSYNNVNFFMKRKERELLKIKKVIIDNGKQFNTKIPGENGEWDFNEE